MTSTGANLALRDAGNGKLTPYWGPDGNPVYDDSEAELVFSLLCELAGWFADQQKVRQSKLPTIKSKDAQTGKLIEQYALDALQPGIDSGRLRSVSPSASPSGSGYLLTVNYVTASGKRPPALTLPLAV